MGLDAGSSTGITPGSVGIAGALGIAGTVGITSTVRAASTAVTAGAAGMAEIGRRRGRKSKTGRPIGW
jgi:hypothetical protein